MYKESLYFIAIILPLVTASEIEIFRLEMAEKYNSKAALKVMPHITLKAPFKLSADGGRELLEWFKSVPVQASTFTIELNNFGSFDNSKNKVIYVRPHLSRQLAALHNDIIISFSTMYPHIRNSTHEHMFNPHITIAYRDLSLENFQLAWDDYRYKTYLSNFVCDRISLLKHNGLRWEVIAENYLATK